MGTCKDNMDLESFIVTKHSWKGKYRRILSIGTIGISTYNPDKFDLTNKWSYTEILSAAPVKTSNIPNEFIITVKKDRKVESIKLSSEYRNDILSSILKYHKEFSDKLKHTQRFAAYKYHWSGISLPIVLEVTPCSLDQLDPTTNEIMTSYMFKDIEGIVGISDYDGGIVIAYGGFSRLHLFKALNHHEIVQNIVQLSLQFLGIEIKILKSQITIEKFEHQRFGKYSGDQFQISMTEFMVHKITSRHPDPVKRIFCLSEVAILERDPQTYSICTLRPFFNIFVLIRDREDLQKFCVEFKCGAVRTYTTTDRDSLLATLLDAIRSVGNKDVHVRSSSTPRGKRLVPFYCWVDEETEANLLRLVVNNFQNQTKQYEILERFNANIPHSGLNYSVSQDSIFAENKEKLISSVLNTLVQKELDCANSKILNLEIEAIFHALTRLLASKVGYAAFTNLPGFREVIGTKIVAALRRNDLAVTYSAIDMINSLMHSVNVEHDLKQEQLNKFSILSSKSFLETLLNMWTKLVNHASGALVLSAMLDFLTFALCVPYSETTDGKQFDVLLELISDRGRCLYKLFQHPSLAIVKGAGLVLRAIIEEGELSTAHKMQALALDEAALCRHLIIALFTSPNDTTLDAHRQLSRHLISLWITDNEEAINLFRRIFPDGLLMFLESDEKVPENALEDDKLNFRNNLKFAIEHSNKNKINVVEKHLLNIKHWGMSLIEQQDPVSQVIKNRPIVLRNRRHRRQINGTILNLPFFFYNFSKDHSLPNLIWNHKTREELRVCLENELRQFANDRDLAANMIVAWNHQEFKVVYQCLSDEIKIGNYYIRIILEKDHWPENLVKDPSELFNALYRRVLCRQRFNDDHLMIISLQALAKVYKCYHKKIGKFDDTSYILQLIERCSSPMLRDTLINLTSCLVLEKENCHTLVEHAQCLVDLMTLSHLHKGRVPPNTKTNLIEAGVETQVHEEKDWYFNSEKDSQKPERQGPVAYSELKELWLKGVINAKTRCWAIGMDGWRSLQQIPQLKWCLIAKGLPLYNETELASKILDILIKCTSFFPSRTQNGVAVLIPGPKLSRKLSEIVCLPHLVQVCLTHQPALLERVAALLSQIMEDNPEMSKIYLTGVFYFMLMYTGSNILPIAKFLKMTHMKQGFRCEETSSSKIFHRSILGQMLPEAMVCVLENNSTEKFSEIFLGEFDTPEVIWSSEMRRLLIEKISAHIADFTPRLKSHTMARYPYLAIPAIGYPQLQNELFCHKYYLRHLCDTQKFPDWPIDDPVHLLKYSLDAWRKEIEKKPASMTVQQAYNDLGIDLSMIEKPDEGIIRKSYYRLAQMYHPDKNPNGREIFEKVNQAYEFLCSRSMWCCDGPNPRNILLILRTQCILFERYSQVLRPYKYAGYPQLIKTIHFETNDDDLFSKEVELLSTATELCYHTIHCSVLNAEELRREGGIEALLEAYSRCVAILREDTKPHQLHYKVISNVTKCFEVACKIENFKNKIITLPELISNVCRVLYFKHSPSVTLVTSLAINNFEVQCDFVRNGVLWSLLLFCFNYDYTLSESGVHTNETTNQQQLANNLAHKVILAILALMGHEFEENKDPEISTTISNNISNEEKLECESRNTLNTSNSETNYLNSAKNPLQGIKCHLNSKEESDISTAVLKFNSEYNFKYLVTSEAKNDIVKKIVDILLTEYISNQLAKAAPSEILKALNSDIRTPYFIWNLSTRNQLVGFLEKKSSVSARERFENISEVSDLVSKFEFDAHKNELNIGGIFISVFNEMPHFPIEHPNIFLKDLLKYLKVIYNFSISKNNFCEKDDVSILSHETQKENISTFDEVLNAYNKSKNHSLMTDYSKTKNEDTRKFLKRNFENVEILEKHTIMTFRAIIDILKSYTEVQDETIGSLDLIFKYFANNIIANKEIKTLALEVVSLISSNKTCVLEIAACDILNLFLIGFKDPDLSESQPKVLETFSGLVNVQEIIKEAYQKGVVIYLLDIYCNSRNTLNRAMCAEILAKLVADRLTGPKVRITISKFLPLLFVEAMTKSPQTSVQLFESIHEHPELIWNDATRSSICNAVSNVCNRFHNTQVANQKAIWKDPEPLQDIISEEIIVSGVYLRLFVRNPAWTLRKPKQFLSDLIDFCIAQISKSSPESSVLDLCTNALVELLRYQPNLADDIPNLGCIPKLFHLLSVQPNNTLSIIHQLTLSEFCVGAFSETESILPLKKCMENYKNCIEKSCEILSRMFVYQNDRLICQSLEVKLIPFLINLLDSKLEYVDNPSTVKAHIVAALKEMTNSCNYGDRISEILIKYPIWSEYRDQKHDLFISDTSIKGYLTGINPTAGYLTQAPVQNIEVLSSPPPIDRDDPSARHISE